MYLCPQENYWFQNPNKMNYKKINPEKNGLVLIVVLWILLILTIFAIGLARKTSLDLLLNRYAMDKLKSYYLAQAAIAFAKAEIAKDTADTQTKDFDSFYKCGINFEEDKNPDVLFKEVLLGEGFFTISYELKEEDATQTIYGLEDEQARINLNAIDINNYKVLSNLIELLGFDSDTALTIASSAADWRDVDSNVFNAPFGAEDSYYSTLDAPYHCQNNNFASLEELMLVRGMNKEIFEKLKDYITIFPKQANSLKVNVNTASRVVLLALANSIPGNYQSVAEPLIQNIIDYRKGDDNIDLEYLDELDLIPDEEGLLGNMKIFLTEKSDYFRVNALGLYKDKKVQSKIVTIIERQSGNIVFWHED